MCRLQSIACRKLPRRGIHIRINLLIRKTSEGMDLISPYIYIFSHNIWLHLRLILNFCWEGRKCAKIRLLIYSASHICSLSSRQLAIRGCPNLIIHIIFPVGRVKKEGERIKAGRAICREDYNKVLWSPQKELFLLTRPYIVPLNNAKFVWLYPAGLGGPEARGSNSTELAEQQKCHFLIMWF